VCFLNQKNGTKSERRSLRKTGCDVLCPVAAWARIITRLSRWNTREGCHLPVNTYFEGGERREVRSKDLIKLLRDSCDANNGSEKYEMRSSDVGTRSIRSGAAMSLALQGETSDRKIMMLGRWKSEAFLKYIRPQVLEWSGDAARIMTRTQSFRDVGEYRGTPKAEPSQPQSSQEQSFEI